MLSSRPFLRALFFALISSSFPLTSACRADVSPWNADAQGQFITALCRDTHGITWVGTEDNGLWRCDPSAPKDRQYTRYTTQDGLGDNNAYALVCDKAGRVWAGTLNHGVSVFNGKAWRTYGPLDGSLGSRVFALAVSPKDGGVWGATDAGLFRYKASRWTYFTRADGLPSDQANALAFAPDGTLYVGTQCDGIAIASPADGYKVWRIVPGPKKQQKTATGVGLPSALINCLLVASSGTVYAGTPFGLAGSRDKGRKWTFLRGADWKAKLAGLLHPVAPVVTRLSTDLLSEDYVTCLAEGGDGRLFVGHRQTGLEAFNARTGQRLQSGESGSKADSDIFGLLASGRSVWVAQYGGGLLTPVSAPTVSSSSVPTPPLPTPAAPPTLAGLNAMLEAVSAVVPDKNELAPKVTALDDDWVTEGDWLGRYGRYWACLNAICSPQDYLWGAGWETVSYLSQIGPKADPDDSLRYFVTSLYTTNPRTLEMPPTYLDSRVQKGLTTQDKNRREAEIDDHGESYSQALDGPNVYQTVTVPSGLFYLSLYDFNKDGHDDYNRFRDYRLSVRTQSGKAIDNNLDVVTAPELAHGRVRDFWGGVWNRFLVRGPLTLTVELSRNNSFNTILQAAMLDLVDELPPPYFGTVDQWNEAQAHQEGQRRQARLSGRIALFQPAATERDAADRLLAVLGRAQFMNSRWWSANNRRFYVPLLRWYTQAAENVPKERQVAFNKQFATCYYETGQYKEWEEVQKQSNLTPARDVEKALRWDGISDGGQGYDVINDYLSNHDTAKVGLADRKN